MKNVLFEEMEVVDSQALVVELDELGAQGNAIQAASDRIKHFDSIFGPAPQGAYRFIVLR